MRCREQVEGKPNSRGLGHRSDLTPCLGLEGTRGEAGRLPALPPSAEGTADGGVSPQFPPFQSCCLGLTRRDCERTLLLKHS